jgi:hypothetical protein
MWRSQRRSLTAGALLMTAGAGGAAAAEKSFSLTIAGAEEVRYTGRCTLTIAAGDETTELSGVGSCSRIARSPSR